MRKWTVSMVALGLFVAGAALPALGQAQPTDPNNNNNGGGRQRGNRGGDPAQFRQQMMDRLKTQLGATDEEWTALQPKLQKVMDAQRDSRGGGFGRGGPGGGRRGGGDQAAPTQPAAATEQSEVAKASADLRTALDNKDTPPADIAGKLKTLRDAKEKAKGSLAQSQKELKELLTQRQEAVLVNMGMLD